MEIVGDWSAGSLCGEKAQMLGLAGCLFAMGASDTKSDAFADALQRAIRGSEDENANETELSVQKLMNTMLNVFVPVVMERGFHPDVAPDPGFAGQEIFAGTVDASPRPPPVPAGELISIMEAGAGQFSSAKGQPFMITDIPSGVPAAQDGSVLPAYHSGQALASSEVAETPVVQQQPVPTGTADKVTTAGLSRGNSDEFALLNPSAGESQPGEIQNPGSFAGEIVRDVGLAREEGLWRDFQRMRLDSTTSAREGPASAKIGTALQPHGRNSPDEGLSLGKTGSAALAQGEMAFGKPEVTTFARASMFLAGNGDGQNGAKNLPDFSMEMAVSILSDGTRVSVAPEQGARFAVGDVPNIGHTHLFDQLVQGVRVAQGNEATEVLVHLKPDFLGRLSIRAIADEHGVHVQIRAENEVVRQVMQDNLADLQQWLAERDLSFSQLSILADTGWHTQREPEWPARYVPGAPAPKPEATIEVPGNPMPHVTRGIIDYFA